MKYYKTALLSAGLLIGTVNFTLTMQNTKAECVAACTICSSTARILYEDSLAIIIKKQPSTLTTSLLIIPKKHLENLNGLNLDIRADQQLLAHLLSLAQMLASRLTGSQNYRITVNNGSALQNMPHLCIEFESNEFLQKA